jgi:hypothetical protein
MWATEVSRRTVATKEQVWRLWADVPNWKVWDKDVESSEIFGQFQTGTKGTLKTTGGPKTNFTMTECTDFRSFTNTSFLPLCKMDFIHTMTESKNGLEIVHKIAMTGVMSFFFSKIIGNKIKAGLPIAVGKLIEIAEQGKMA